MSFSTTLEIKAAIDKLSLHFGGKSYHVNQALKEYLDALNGAKDKKELGQSNKNKV